MTRTIKFNDTELKINSISIYINLCGEKIRISRPNHETLLGYLRITANIDKIDFANYNGKYIQKNLASLLIDLIHEMKSFGIDHENNTITFLIDYSDIIAINF